MQALLKITSLAAVVFHAGVCATPIEPTVSLGSKPAGTNCDIEVRPASAGEFGEFGTAIWVYPRKSQINRKYTGCQVVFASEKEGAEEILWIVKVVGGEPVRIWSNHPRAKLECSYRKGELIKPALGYCPENKSMLLFPSLPPGCMSEQGAVSQPCVQD